LGEGSKYDLFIDELNALEKQIYYFIQKGSELMEANSALNNKIIQLEKENDILKKKISEIELKVNKTLFNEGNLFGSETIKLEEREVLKNKISELIARIDYHLRS
jgi:predicted  nucleic acid-binding Zn-ribbon protein